MKPVFTGTVSNGRLELNNKAYFLNYCKSFEGKQIVLTIDKATKKRSNSQNAYYWGVVIKSVIEGLVNNGYPKSELDSDCVHEYLKEKFLKAEVASELTGDIMKINRKSSSLTTEEFGEYIDEIQRWASEWLGIIIPDAIRE